MKKQVLHYDETGYKADSNTLEKSLNWFQGLLDRANEVGALKIQSMADLQRIARDGSKAYRELLIERTPQQELAGIPLKPENIVDSLDVDASGIDAYMPEPWNKPSWEPNFLEISGNTVRIRKGALDELKERHTRYARNEKEAKLFDAQQKARDAIQHLNEVAQDVGAPQLLPPESTTTNDKMNFLSLYVRNVNGDIKVSTNVYNEIKR